MIPFCMHTEKVDRMSITQKRPFPVVEVGLFQLAPPKKVGAH